ncbi:MAG: transketolase C-terminal domain-containing protein [Candidatus Fimivivens sp.]|nr:transketolase C-terminal domain-containing protein [Candidatus Fimivivens sp.]
MLEITSISARTWARLGQRGAIFGIALPEIIKENKDIRVITADLALLSGLDRFKTSNPDKFINAGIAEQNMMGIAAGLAKEGNCVFATTYATFIAMRSFEQIRHNLGYMKYNVKVVGASSGIVMGMSGNTHYAIEDIAIMRAIPNMTVLSPADSVEAVKMAEAVSRLDGPAYIRLTGELNCPMVYKTDYDFEIGKGVVLQQGEDVAIIAAGTMVAESIAAAKLLNENGKSVTVINMHTIKPLDTQLLDEVFAKHKLIVTVEEHSIIGGLGSAVAEYKSGIADAPVQMMIGMPDMFGKAGEYKYLLEQYGLTAKAIAERIERKLQ